MGIRWDILINYCPGNEQLVLPENHGCACPGSVLTFNCTTVGVGTTLWRGTAFKCQSTGNQITLLNSLFASGGVGSSGACNNGDIMARGISADGNCYTSQLNITVSPGLNQTSVECIYSSDRLSTIGTSALYVLLGKASINCIVSNYKI